MLPRPSLSFTLPSLHDASKLDCRVYHPHSTSCRWGGHAAVVAHPYAPLGGCYDDPIVDVVAGTLLQLGFLVATFNFRGASSAGGRTSWTSKPEQADYMSVAGFLAYYAHCLDPLPQRPSAADDESPLPVMLFAGYSYGAMVTMKLPALPTIMASFHSPAVNSPAADIRLRAQHLAEQQNKLSEGSPTSPRHSLGMRVGGGDDEPARQSRDRRGSMSLDGEERIRKGVRDILSRTKLVQRKRRNTEHSRAEDAMRDVTCMEPMTSTPKFRSAYLLVSPPVGVTTSLATMSLSSLNPLPALFRRASKPGGPSATVDGSAERGEEDEAETKLVRNPSLTVYGEQDGFVTARRMREWTTSLQNCEGSQFRHIEFPGAGHFWAEDGAVYELRDAVGRFATDLLVSNAAAT